jgi:hypothetical protein
MLGFHVTDSGHEFAHAVMRGMAHIDAEYVGAGREELIDHRPLRRGRTERCHNLGPAQTSHLGVIPDAVRRDDAPRVPRFRSS